MERRFKTSNHSNEQAKRISIEASSIDKKKGKKERREDRMHEKKMERRGTRARFLSAFNRDFEDHVKSLFEDFGCLMKIYKELT